MKEALSVTLCTALILGSVERGFGSDVLYQVASGAIVTMSAVIAATFLWLWHVRATPLALGMAFSWAGSALTLGWWWILAARGASTALSGHPALMMFVAIYATGAVLHFSVIGPSLRWPRHAAWLFPVGALALSATGVWLS